jgi:hypothetical protein
MIDNKEQLKHELEKARVDAEKKLIDLKAEIEKGAVEGQEELKKS